MRIGLLTGADSPPRSRLGLLSGGDSPPRSRLGLLSGGDSPPRRRIGLLSGGPHTRSGPGALVPNAAKKVLAPLVGPSEPTARWLWNLRAGRIQKTLAGTVAASGLPLGLEMYLEHYKGSFGDIWMWSPILTSPLVSAAGLAGVRSGTAARTVLPWIGALYALNGVIGTYTHLRGVQRKPGGFSEPTYNLVMGPPLLAPGSLILIGALAMLAAIVERER